tara:strand:+ start:544 stop:843 length:300 start_codon:yes stop_codon:yes gene_type:complete
MIPENMRFKAWAWLQSVEAWVYANCSAQDILDCFNASVETMDLEEPDSDDLFYFISTACCLNDLFLDFNQDNPVKDRNACETEWAEFLVNHYFAECGFC